MPDQLTTEERNLISEAIKLGRVTKIPTGRSSVGVSYVWCHKINRLVLTDEAAQTKKNNWGQSDYRSRQAVLPHISERREKVLAAVNEGLSSGQIAKKLRVRLDSVRADIARMRKNGIKVELTYLKRKRENAEKSAKIQTS